MLIYTHERIAVSWENELHKEQTSQEREAENTIKRVNVYNYLMKEM